MEEERLRPPSPPPVVHYTDHEAAAVSEKIKQDDTFTKAVQVRIRKMELVSKRFFFISILLINLSIVQKTLT